MKSLKKNYAYNMVYQILQMILPFVTAPYIARVFGTKGVGIFSYTHSIAYYFLLIGMLGINNYGNRSIAKVRDNKQNVNSVFFELYSVQLSISLFFLIIYVIIFIIFNKINRMIYIAQLPYVLSACFDINWFFGGLEQFKITVTRNIIIKIITTINVFLFVKKSDDVILYAWIMNIGYFIGQCYLWLSIKKYISFCKFDFKKAISTHLKPMAILFIPMFATSVYRVMDKVMIGSLCSYSEVGLYENADKIVMICLGVVTAWGNVMLPRISNLVANNNIEQCNVYLRKSLQFISCITAAMGFGICSIANQFVTLFYGKDFLGSGVLLSGLSFTLIFIGWSNTIRNQVLIPMEKDRYYVRAIVIGAVLNLIINTTLIPVFGSIGAMIGTITAELTATISQIIPIKKSIKIKCYLLDAIPFMVMGIIMSSTVYAIGKLFSSVTIINIMIQIIVGVIVYSVLCIIYFIRHKDSFGFIIIKKILGLIHVLI